MSAQVRDGDGVLAFDKPRELFRADFARGDHLSELGTDLPHIPYDVSPDGQRFLVNERTGSAPATTSPWNATVVVVLNWTTMLGE